MSAAFVIPPDERNLIDLPGVGPCPRPVDIDTALTGFRRLGSLRAYRFDGGQRIEGESEVDEVWITPVSGAVRLEISGAHPLETDLASGRLLYMTPGHAYRLVPSAPALVAYARARAEGRIGCHLAAGTTVTGEHLSARRAVLEAGGELDIASGETLALVARGLGKAGNSVLGPLDTLAVPDGAQARITAGTEMELWIYTA